MLQVWSALPYMAPFPLHKFPSPPAGSDKSHGDLPPASKPMPITLVIAQTDTGGFFHDNVQAAGSPTSGLVAMLTAMDLLKIGADPSAYTRRIIFLALAGEPWGYMGSRRLLWELDPKGAASWNLTILPASATNPGVPPSSLMSFLRYKPSIQYKNPYYHSILDNGTYVQVEALVSTAILLARTLHTLASAGTPTAPLQVDKEAVRARAVDLGQSLMLNEPVDKAAVRARAVDLGKCLMLDDPGLLCSLSYSMMKEKESHDADGEDDDEENDEEAEEEEEDSHNAADEEEG
eukprot:gene24579-10192_t